MPQTVIPQLRMRHADTTLPFYVQGLGFVVDWEHRFEPGFPLFAQLTRDGQTIFLTEHSGDSEVCARCTSSLTTSTACTAPSVPPTSQSSSPRMTPNGAAGKCCCATRMATGCASPPTPTE